LESFDFDEDDDEDEVGPYGGLEPDEDMPGDGFRDGHPRGEEEDSVGEEGNFDAHAALLGESEAGNAAAMDIVVPGRLPICLLLTVPCLAVGISCILPLVQVWLDDCVVTNSHTLWNTMSAMLGSIEFYE
jgi:hypothetical protein